MLPDEYLRERARLAELVGAARRRLDALGRDVDAVRVVIEQLDTPGPLRVQVEVASK